MRVGRLLPWFAGALLLGSTAFAGEVKPKKNAQEYRYYELTPEYTIGVNLLTPGEAETRLATPLSETFFAVEVAIFPRNGKAVKVDAKEFTLREAESGRTSLPMVGEEVAGAVHRNAKKPKRDVTLYPTVGVGVATGRSGPYSNDPYDPAIGNRPGSQTRTGTNVGVGVGVGIGNEKQPGGEREDLPVMKSELADLALESGSFDHPVAGFVYFPRGRMAIDSRKVLEYRDPAKPATAEPLRIDLTPILGP